MYRILFLIRSLEIGGAERQLVELVKNLDHTRFRIQVVTFYDGGALEPLIENIPGVQLTSLRKSNRWDLVHFFRELIQVVKLFHPHIIQSYLDVPNSFTVIAGKYLGIKTSIGASASYVDFSRYDWTASLVYKTGAFLSRFANKVIANSNAGEKYNIEHGYSAKNMIVIHNGIDTNTFRPDKLARARMRSLWNIDEGEKIIGVIGRLDPMKDHPTFLRAAAQVAHQVSKCRFICIGRGNQAYQDEMKMLASTLLNANQVLWINNCEDKDLPAAYNAFDVLVSSSYGEGLSVVIGEGMASGVPCVVTDVGDSAFAVGEAGLVVASKNPALLASAICKLLEMSKQERFNLGQKGRQRVQEYFSVNKMVSSYESTFEELAKG